MKPAVKIAVAISAVSAAALCGWLWLRPGSGMIRNRALARREIATRVLAECLALEAPGAKALVVANPFAERPNQPAEVYSFDEASIQGLKKGWGERIQLRGVARPSLKAEAVENPGAVPIDPHTTTPLSFLTSDGAWDRLWNAHRDTDLWISLIGVPLDLGELELWRTPRPRLALLLPDLRMLGGREGLARLLVGGKLVAVVLNRPGAPPESEDIERNYRDEFDRRFLLLTAQNLDAVARVYPQLF